MACDFAFIKQNWAAHHFQRWLMMNNFIAEHYENITVEQVWY